VRTHSFTYSGSGTSYYQGGEKTLIAVYTLYYARGIFTVGKNREAIRVS
jgi:hypothetical protein